MANDPNKQYLIDAYMKDKAAGHPVLLKTYGITQEDVDNAGVTSKDNTGNNNSSSDQGNTNQPPVLKSTGNSTLDAWQDSNFKYVTGSLANGYTINPLLSASNLTSLLPQFLQETAAQLEPQLKQDLQNEVTGVNQAIKTYATVYGNTQGQTIQDFQQTLGTTRNAAGASGTYLGGGERALENGLLNSANRSLSSLDAQTQLQIGNQLRAGGAAVGQGMSGNPQLGVPGVNNGPQGGFQGMASNFGLNANSFNIPSIYGRTLSLGGGDSTFAGSSNLGNALDFGYDPSIYTSGSLPQQFQSAFGNTLNTNIGNYQAQAGAKVPTPF